MLINPDMPDISRHLLILAMGMALIDNEEDKIKFEKMYNTYQEYMFNIALSILKNEALAEETVQDCFLIIAKKISGVVDVDSKKTKAMVSIMVKNKARNNLKLEHRERFDYTVDDEVLQELEEKDSVYDTLVDEVLSKIGYNNIVEEIKNLDDIYREILTLQVQYEYSAQEISEILQIPIRTVENRIYRGRKILREKLEGKYNEFFDKKENF